MSELILEIMNQGYDRLTAGRFAILIGDRPIKDEVGNLVVMDGDTVLARLTLAKC